jgi:thiosulfate/3-mercaptopyruvate sulfurtransferase
MKTRFPLFARGSAHGLRLITVATALALNASASLCRGGPSPQNSQADRSASVPWHEDQIIQPEQLAKTLAAVAGRKPLVICVGFPFLYQDAHIAGARFAGPASKPEGLQALKHEVQHLPRDKEIVLYCGCCPWKRCPNIRPAFRTMQDLGFKRVKLLSIPTNLAKDWSGKGFPVQKGADRK